MSRSTRRRLVEIDGVGLARRMGEEFELALFDIDMARLGGEALEALVDHVRLLCLAEEGDDAGAAEAEIMLERMAGAFDRSEEHTSELQSLMRTSTAVYRLKKKKC